MTSSQLPLDLMRIAACDAGSLTPRHEETGHFAEECPFRSALPSLPGVCCPLVRESGAARVVAAAIRAQDDANPPEDCILALTPGETRLTPNQTEFLVIEQKFNPEMDLMCYVVAKSLITVYYFALPHPVIIPTNKDKESLENLPPHPPTARHRLSEPLATTRAVYGAILRQRAEEYAAINHQIKVFVRQLAAALYVSPATMLGGLILLDRCVSRGMSISRTNILILFIVAVRLVSKVLEFRYLCEKSYPPKDYLLPKSYMHYVEEQMLCALHFSIAIFPRQISTYAFQIVRRTMALSPPRVIRISLLVCSASPHRRESERKPEQQLQAAAPPVKEYAKVPEENPVVG